MPTVIKRATFVASTTGTTWANTNLLVDGSDTTYATWTNATRDAVGGIRAGEFNLAADLPANAVIDGVRGRISHYVNTSTPISGVDVKFYGGAAIPIQAPQASPSAVDFTSPDTFDRNTLVSTYFDIEVIITRLRSTTSTTYYIGYIDVIVDYSIPVKPAAPTLSATGSYSGVQLSWNAISGATEYQVYRSDIPATTLYVGPATTHLDATAVAGTNYTYTVFSKSNGGFSDESAPASAKRLAGTKVYPASLAAATAANAVWETPAGNGTTMSDNFNRPDTDNGLGTASDGGTWTYPNGDSNIVVRSQKTYLAVKGTNASNTGIAMRNLGTADVDIQARIYNNGGSYDGVYIGGNGTANSPFLQVGIQGLWQHDGTTWYQYTLITPPATIDTVTGRLVRVVKKGNVVEVFYDGVSHGTVTLNSQGPTGTWHGLNYDSGDSLFDDFTMNNGTSQPDVKSTTITPITAITDEKDATYYRLDNSGAVANGAFVEWGLPNLSDIDTTNPLQVDTRGRKSANANSPRVSIVQGGVERGANASTIATGTVLGDSSVMFTGTQLTSVPDWATARLRYDYTSTATATLDLANVSLIYTKGAAAPPPATGHGQMVGVPI